jgi:hypothetical protein
MINSKHKLSFHTSTKISEYLEEHDKFQKHSITNDVHAKSMTFMKTLKKIICKQCVIGRGLPAPCFEYVANISCTTFSSVSRPFHFYPKNTSKYDAI